MGSACRRPSKPLTCRVCHLPETVHGWRLKDSDVYVCCSRCAFRYYEQLFSERGFRHLH